MPPKRNTAHLHRANGKTACGRMRGMFTPNVLHFNAFGLNLKTKTEKPCKYCLKAYRHLLPGGSR